MTSLFAWSRFISIRGQSKCSSRSVGLAAAICFAAASLWASPAAGALQGSQFGGTDNNIGSLARYGNTLYVSGFFSQAGPITGNCVAVNPSTGALLAGFPRFTGSVSAIIPDGKRGWFVGGAFTAINGVAHGGLAHLDQSYQVLPWNPAPDGPVNAIAITGDSLFVGGDFQRVYGISRPYLATLSSVGGELLAPPPAPDRRVNALLADRGMLFIGGGFSHLAGQARNGIAGIEVSRGVLSAWGAALGDSTHFTEINALAVMGDTILAGGVMTNPDLTERCLAAIGRSSGGLVDWNPQFAIARIDRTPGLRVFALATTDTSVIVGGHFVSVNGIRRGGLAELGFPSGLVTGWNPDPGPWLGEVPEGDIAALLIADGRLYASGWFESLGSVDHRFMAVFDLQSRAVLPWELGANFGVTALAKSDSVLLAGGEFQGAGPDWRERRPGLAAFDLSTGRLKPWNPRLSGLGVNSIVAARGKIFVGGYFDSLGGQSRYCLGAVDTLLGDADDWDPACDGPVLTLQVQTDTLYVGGAFTSLAGQPRSFVGAFDLRNRALADWAPTPNDAVWTIQPAGQRVFLGGEFRSVNGVARIGAVAVDAATGVVDPFDCQMPFAGIQTMFAAGETLYVGGGFTQIGGKSRMDLAALDARTGRVLDWRADANGYLTSMVKLDTVLYVGGTFAAINGFPHRSFAAISTHTGQPLPLDPDLNGTVWGMLSDGDMLYLGGGSTRAFGDVQAGLLGIPLGPAPAKPPPPPPSLSLSPMWPNPASEQVSLEFAVPSTQRISIEIYDVQGRLVKPLLVDQKADAGRHRVSFSIAGLSKGIYLCRISVGSMKTTRKFVVVR